jgi:hypothetical protein
MPPGVGFWPGPEDWSTGGWGPPPVKLASSFVFLLPFIEQDNMWRSYTTMNNFADGWSPWCKAPKTYINPADPSYGSGTANVGTPTLCYAANSAALGNYGYTFGDDTYDRHRRANLNNGFPDGTSNTVVFTERYAVPGWDTDWGNSFSWPWGWIVPCPVFAAQNATIGLTLADPNRPNSAHPGTALAGLADGSVRGISSGISSATWTNACRPADGQVLGSDW